MANFDSHSSHLTLSQDLDKIKRTLQEYFNITLETRDTSLKGWNWGEAQVKGVCNFIHRISKPLTIR